MDHDVVVIINNIVFYFIFIDEFLFEKCNENFSLRGRILDLRKELEFRQSRTSLVNCFAPPTLFHPNSILLLLSSTTNIYP
jgi:hypothetical protein